MGVSGGGLDELDSCQNANMKERFWADLLEELKNMGDERLGSCGHQGSLAEPLLAIQDVQQKAARSGAGVSSLNILK
jgi:hypothetical protein